jgi:hypothetical protein
MIFIFCCNTNKVFNKNSYTLVSQNTQFFLKISAQCFYSYKNNSVGWSYFKYTPVSLIFSVVCAIFSKAGHIFFDI